MKGALRLLRGRWAENRACSFLRDHGLQLLHSNYRCPFGEIDLIMQDGEHLVFIEVRYRRSERYGGALASVDRVKQRKLRATAEHFRQSSSGAGRYPCRFDVICIAPERIEWIKDAF